MTGRLAQGRTILSPMKKENIQNIIFDLGDVILNIDIPLTFQAFAELSGLSIAELGKIFNENEIFRKFETGKLSEPQFRQLVRNILEMPHLTDLEIDNAWNTLLLDIPPARIELLHKLAQKYRLFLLSNTSSIHIRRVNEIIKEVSGIAQLNHLFEKVFLSYELGYMKPDHDIYRKVLEMADIIPEQTLFLDDNLANTNAAKELGIKVIHVQKPSTIIEYLTPYV